MTRCTALVSRVTWLYVWHDSMCDMTLCVKWLYLWHDSLYSTRFMCDMTHHTAYMCRITSHVLWYGSCVTWLYVWHDSMCDMTLCVTWLYVWHDSTAYMCHIMSHVSHISFLCVCICAYAYVRMHMCVCIYAYAYEPYFTWSPGDMSHMCDMCDSWHDIRVTCDTTDGTAHTRHGVTCRIPWVLHRDV